jgi:hypothetical protein
MLSHISVLGLTLLIVSFAVAFIAQRVSLLSGARINPRG